MAPKGLGACGEVELGKSLWGRAVPKALLLNINTGCWLRESGGLLEMLQSLVAEGCLLKGGVAGGLWLPESHGSCQRMKKNAFSCSTVLNKNGLHDHPPSERLCCQS